MSNRRWRRHADPDNAVDELLDAAGRAFAEFGVARATMVDVARMAGCSRATLYRYYPDQDSLHLAFVHRATLRIAEEMAADHGSGAPDSLAERILGGIAHVRADPLLAVWFEPENMSVPIALSQSSALLRSMTIGLIGGTDETGETGESTLDPDDLERRAGWILRSIVTLLAMPGADKGTERKMIEEFVVPVVTGARARSESG